MKKIVLVVCLFFVVPVLCYGQEVEPLKVYFFHNNPCAACDERGQLNQALSTIDVDGIAFRIVEFPVFEKESAAAVSRLRALIDQPKYPLLLIGDRVIEGYDDMRVEFLDALKAYSENPRDLLFGIDEYIPSEDVNNRGC